MVVILAPRNDGPIEGCRPTHRSENGYWWQDSCSKKGEILGNEKRLHQEDCFLTDSGVKGEATNGLNMRINIDRRW